MIKIDPYDNQTFKFKATLEGIDPQILEYHLRFSIGNIDYGFKGEYEDGIVKFNVPPLTEVMTESALNKIHSVRLEAHDKNNKYYLKPYQDDDIKIKKEPKFEATLTSVEEDNSTEKMNMNAEMIEDEEKSFKEKQKKYKEKPKEDNDNEEDETKERQKKKKEKGRLGKFLSDDK